MNSLISVIMSVYNENEDVLKQAIESILNQSYRNIEFIIVLDNPENSSLKHLLFDYVEKDTRVNVIVNEQNIGLAGSLNKAIDVCQGVYVARMDADDISLVDRLKIQKYYLDKNPDVVLCSTKAKKIGDSNKYIKSKYFRFDEINACLVVNNCIIHPAVMFRKKFLDTFHMRYDESFLCAQDYELWSRIAGIGRMAVLDKVLLYYRVHQDQISSSKKEKQLQMAKIILKNQLERHGLDCSTENLRLHMILSRYESCDKESLPKLVNWVEYIIRSLENKKDYSRNSLSVILKSNLISCVLKSNIDRISKIKFFLKYRVVNDFSTFCYFVETNMRNMKRVISKCVF